MNNQIRITLNNGVEIPMLGFGTFKIPDGKVVIQSVKKALELGYSHIDTAAYYKNETGVGEGIRQSGVSRSEIFLTSKVWTSDYGYDNTIKAYDMSLQRLGVDYLDLYLIHWYNAKVKDTWQALEKLYQEKRVRAIGVSNFHINHLEALFTECEIKPMINQVEFHPRLLQLPLFEYCKKQQIQYEAYSPLMQGKIFNIPLLVEFAEKYKRTIAQVVLRWNIQMGVVTIPKSIHPDRMLENMQIFDFEISEEDMQAICLLDNGQRIGHNPDRGTKQTKNACI
jgi:diketogulonate reductase-like aldo/keto reductase